MDDNFVDLDILLTRILQPSSRTYFLEAVKAYRAGALRAAISSIWIAVVYDLISKYRELDGLGDAAATSFVSAWDRATASGDTTKLLQLEGTILEDAVANTQLVDRAGETHLSRLRQDRHRCAHPAFSTEAELFEPSPELVRLHLVNAIKLVLAQEPLQGKRIFEQFDLDVQSLGFPNTETKLTDYVEQRYLRRTRSQYIRNFGTVLAKSLLKGTPPEWDRHRRKIASSLAAIRDRASQSWPDVRHAIIRLIDTLEPRHRIRGIVFLAAFPGFWDELNASTKTALLETARNADFEGGDNYGIFGAVKLAEMRPIILDLIDSLGTDQLRDAISVEPLIEFWPEAISTYQYSPSFRRSEANFREFISPLASLFKRANYDELLDTIVINGQNWEASGTPDLLATILRNAASDNLPSQDARNRFYQHLAKMSRLDRYSDSIKIFEQDGWLAPPSASADDVE